MLYDVDRRQYIENIPHSVEYDTWRSRLTDEQVAAIRGELRGRIDRDKILTSSFIPGSDWTGTVFQPIYEHACRLDTEASALCFGLFLWRNLSTTLRHRRLRFTEQSLLLWMWMWQVG